MYTTLYKRVKGDCFQRHLWKALLAKTAICKFSKPGWQNTKLVAKNCVQTNIYMYTCANQPIYIIDYVNKLCNTYNTYLYININIFIYIYTYTYTYTYNTCHIYTKIHPKEPMYYRSVHYFTLQLWALHCSTDIFVHGRDANLQDIECTAGQEQELPQQFHPIPHCWTNPISCNLSVKNHKSAKTLAIGFSLL